MKYVEEFFTLAAGTVVLKNNVVQFDAFDFNSLLVQRQLKFLREGKTQAETLQQLIG